MSTACDHGMALRPARVDELRELVAIDDDASQLYAGAGLDLLLANTHPYVVAESARWEEAIARGLAHVAVDHHDKPVGFVTLGHVDGQPYVDQIAVRQRYMRRGVGTALLLRAIAWSAGKPLWLTTYSHLSWNRPYYERHGFVVVPDAAHGAQLCAILQQQRAALPEAGQRVAMVRRP